MENGNFTVIPKTQVPKGEKILPTVWQMKRKQDIKTQKIKKYKASVHFWDTYAPVASWNSIH
jgi:hypothetical protein